MQRAVRRAAEMRLAARHFELAARPCRDPDLAALIEVEDAGDALERVRIIAEAQRASVLLERQHRRFAAPVPEGAELVHGVVRRTLAAEREPSIARLHRIAAAGAGQPAPVDHLVDARMCQDTRDDALDHLR